jgi:hypothetical protein
MRMKRMLLGVLAAVCVSPLVIARGAEQKPDFSGAWVATKDKPSTLPAAPSPVFGEKFWMKQTGPALEMYRPVRGRPEPILTNFAIDGPEIRVMTPARTCLASSGQMLTMSWDGNALVYAVTGTVAPGATTPTRNITFKYIFRLEAPDTLVIESMMRDPNGGTTPIAVGSVYKKSAEPMPAVTVTPKPVTAPATIAQVDWIAGTWSGQGGTAATAPIVEERWTAAAGGAMLGVSRTTSRTTGVMTEFEFLCISERDGSLVYSAMPNAAAPTDFHLTKIDADSATFENPAHDFPKMIRYVRKPDGTMDAIVSGAAGQRALTFTFKKQ